jgi:hypothetical protein
MVLLSRHRWGQVGTVVVDLTLHAVLVIAYFFAVLQWLNEPLVRLFQEHLTHYAVVSLLLILGQGMLLDMLTSGVLHLVRRGHRRRRE